jgi:hypothetical protein
MGGIYMKKPIFDKDGYEDTPEEIKESLLTAKRIVDDLPRPGHFARKQSRESISIDSQVINYFKEYAKQHNVQYQTAINDFLLSHISR